MKDKIHKVLEKYADLQINLGSQAARDILANDLERLSTKKLTILKLK